MTVKMDIHTFIQQNEFKDFYEFEEWNYDLYYMLYNNKDILITRKVAKLLFLNNHDLDDDLELARALQKYVSVLIENNIRYKIINSTRNLFIEYPNIDKYDDLFEWISIEPKEFQKSLLFVENNQAWSKYFLLEDVIIRYKAYRVQQQQMQTNFDQMINQLCSLQFADYHVEEA